MRIGRWSDLRTEKVCQEHAVMREAGANEAYVDLCSVFSGTLVGYHSQICY